MASSGSNPAPTRPHRRPGPDPHRRSRPPPTLCNWPTLRPGSGDQARSNRRIIMTSHPRPWSLFPASRFGGTEDKSRRRGKAPDLTSAPALRGIYKLCPRAPPLPRERVLYLFFAASLRREEKRKQEWTRATSRRRRAPTSGGSPPTSTSSTVRPSHLPFQISLADPFADPLAPSLLAKKLTVPQRPTNPSTAGP